MLIDILALEVLRQGAFATVDFEIERADDDHDIGPLRNPAMAGVRVAWQCFEKVAADVRRLKPQSPFRKILSLLTGVLPKRLPPFRSAALRAAAGAKVGNSLVFRGCFALTTTAAGQRPALLLFE
jgi:hypothetical protein